MKLLCFGKWTDGHLVFCRWLSSIAVFAVPSCSPSRIQKSSDSVRSQDVISLNALCTLVIERQFVVSFSYGYFNWVGIFWISIQRMLSSPVLSPTANTCTWRRQLVMKMTEDQLLCATCSKDLTSTCASFPSTSFSSSWSLRPCSRAWLRTDASSSNITGQFTFTNFAHHWQFLRTQISRSVSSNRMVILWLWWRCNVCRQYRNSIWLCGIGAMILEVCRDGHERRSRFGLSAHSWQSRQFRCDLLVCRGTWFSAV